MITIYLILTVDELKKHRIAVLKWLKQGQNIFFFKMGIIHCMYILEKKKGLSLSNCVCVCVLGGGEGV